MEEILLKIPSNGRNYHLMVVYPKQEPLKLEITLLDGAKVWYGEVFQEELEKQAEAIEKTFSEYWSCTSKALSCEPQKEGFCYDVKFNDDHAEFSWKQVLKHGIKFQLGSINLQKTEQKTLTSFLDTAVDQHRQMKAEISTLSTVNQKLLKEREASLKKLEECVKAKNNMEKDLFQKFTALLNAKKTKIRELKKPCKDNLISSQRREAQDVAGSNRGDSNEDDEDTDDEKEREQDISTGKRRGQKRMPAILDENCDEEVDGQPPTLKRKSASRRKRGTTSTTVIPRTTSLPRPAKQDSFSRNTRSSQKQSSTPTNLHSDPERLLDEL